MKIVSFCSQDWIIGRPRNPYTPVTREDDKLASVLSKPRSSALAEPRQRQTSLRKGGATMPLCDLDFGACHYRKKCPITFVPHLIQEKGTVTILTSIIVHIGIVLLSLLLGPLFPEINIYQYQGDHEVVYQVGLFHHGSYTLFVVEKL